MSETTEAEVSPTAEWERSTIALTMEGRIRRDRHDVDAWRVLLAEAADHTPAQFRPVFEAAVSAMPLSAPLWMRWVEAELRACEAEQVEAIFELCLLRCPQLPLWQLFLNFIKGVKLVGLDAASARSQLLPALELTLEAVGADPVAGPLWQEYVSLTAASEAGAEANDALVSSSELAATRKAYQTAICSPAAGLESLARDYEAWETRVSGAQAKLMMQDTPEKGLAARNVAQQRYSLYAPLRAASACAHGHLPNGIATPRRLNAFRKLWAFEAANPQRLEPAKLLARMRFTLSQGVGALWRAPQLWHEAASWFAKQGHDQVAREVWNEGLQVLPSQSFLYLGLASFEERSRQIEAATTLLDTMVTAAPSAAAHIARIRFAWRTGGREAGRNAFAEARRAPRSICSWHVYAAAAQLEYMLGSDERSLSIETARRILSLALSKEEAHATERATNVDPGLVFAIASFLASCADLPNLREHLERALVLLPNPPHSTRLWDMYARIESQFGTAASQASIAERRSATTSTDLPDSSSGSLASQNAVSAAQAAAKAAAAAAAGTPLPGSLAALAADHSYEGISPAGTANMLAIEAAVAAAAGIPTQMTPQSAAVRGFDTGGGNDIRKPPAAPLVGPPPPPAKILRPNLLSCIEYTGVEHRHMEKKRLCEATANATTPSGVALVAGGPEIASRVATLPPRSSASVHGPTPCVVAASADTQSPGSYRPPGAMAASVGRSAGGIDVQWGGVPVVGAHDAASGGYCGRDIYSARASMAGVGDQPQPLGPG